MKNSVLGILNVCFVLMIYFLSFGQCGSSVNLIDWTHQNANLPGQMQYGAFVPGGGTYDESGTFTTTCSSPLTMTMNFTRNSGTSNGIAGLDYNIQQNADATSTFTLSFSIPIIVEDLTVFDVDMNSGYHDNLVFSANYNGNNVPVTLAGNAFVAVNNATQTVSALTGSPEDLGSVSVNTAGQAVSEISFVYNSLSGSGQQILFIERNLQLCCPNPLPIELSHFSAEKSLDKKGANIRWSTLTERNNDYFIVQRSLDGENWIDARRIEGAGNSLSKLSYSLHDNYSNTGLVYYRLVQFDFDGKFTYSKIETVNFSSQVELIVTTNPTVNGMVNFELKRAKGQEGLISITDMSGESYWRRFVNVDSNSFDIGVPDNLLLPSGMYIVRISFKDGCLFERLVII